ncbi:MAG: trimethylamine methyltransferase family protein [Chloroflexota bacterium]
MSSNIMSNDCSFGSAHFRRLSDQQCQKLYWACLKVLERTGVRIYDQAALDLLKKAGASISDGNRVRIPNGLVEKALSTAPKRVTLYNRYGEPVMPVEGYRSFFGPGSDCLNIIDHRTNQRRPAVLQDIIDGMTIADALPNIDFVMCMFLPSDVNQAVLDRYEMEVMLNYTAKPIIFVTTEFSGCADAVEMAEAVAGGAEALRRRPMVAPYINVTTGLIHNQEAVQKLLYMAEKGLPATYIPSTQGGATAPVTPAGAMVVAQTGVLAGLVMSQLKREGAPFIMPGWGGNMLDMRTTVQPYADPDKRAIVLDYGHFLGLPMFALAGVSDSKVVDQQAAAEAAMTLLTDTLAGGHIVHDLGYLESGLTGSLVQLTICDELLNWIAHFVQGVDTSDEALCLDLIDEVGPDGFYIDHDHTYKHFRERWYPGLFERDNYEGWLSKGGQTLAERATDKVAKILAEHKPEPLPKDVAQQVRAIVKRAEAAVG